MKHSIPKVDRAIIDVHRELNANMLMTNKLKLVEVYLQPIDLIGYEGIYVEEAGRIGGLLGYADRSIYIPSINFASLVKYCLGFGRQVSSLRDVLRHEYGHAFAVEHPRLIRRNSEFVDVFGGRYDGEYEECEFDSEMYLTEYATVSPAEDFAETFMVFLRSNGDIERYRKRRGVYKKLKFVKRLGKKLGEKHF